MCKFVQVGIVVGFIYGNKSQNQCDCVICDLCVGDIMVLVVIDVVVCGIDIFGVSYVYNFELFEVVEVYVYWIGWMVCVGVDGDVVVLCVLEEIGLLCQIEKLIGIDIVVVSGEVLLVLVVSKLKCKGNFG